MRWMEKMRRLARTINRLGWFWSTRVKARAKTVNGLIQRLARSELIEHKPDPSDRRVQRIFLTERGRALKQITPSLEQDVNARALDGFSEDEQRFFNRLLSRALHNMRGK